MSGRNLALTGVPRSGTTLCCQLLGRANQVVALFEPMQVELLPQQHSAALMEIKHFFEDSRASLLADGSAWSQQVGGVVPDNPFANHVDGEGRRKREAERGRILIDKPLTEDFALVVKHNAAFTALLPGLAQDFEVCAVVRNPLAVLASWHSVSLPVSRGRLPAGERLDPDLARRLDNEPDVLARQLAILDWLFSRYVRWLPATRILAYEDVVSSAGGALAAAFGLELPPLPLQERNASRLYDLRTCQHLAQRLLTDRGAWRERYQDSDIERLLQRMHAEAS